MKTRSVGFHTALVMAAVFACATCCASAFAHDMSAMDGSMGGMQGSMAPNAMGSHMHMDAHMRMTALRPATPQDIERAHYLLDTLRRSISRYKDSRVALAEGFQIFLPTISQDVYHFVDYPASAEEGRGHFDATRPGSLLYVKNSDGSYALVGAMYNAPPDATPEELDAIVPLGIARWHVHTDICLPNGITLNDVLRGDIGAQRSDVPGMLPVSASSKAIELNRRYGFLADGRFGFEGKISDPQQCLSAGGHFIPQAFGWMVHIYPFAGDNLKVAFGTSVPKLTALSPSASR